LLFFILQSLLSSFYLLYNSLVICYLLVSRPKYLGIRSNSLNRFADYFSNLLVIVSSFLFAGANESIKITLIPVPKACIDELILLFLLLFCKRWAFLHSFIIFIIFLLLQNISQSLFIFVKMMLLHEYLLLNLNSWSLNLLPSTPQFCSYLKLLQGVFL
jgi:hypothetical protein